MIGKKTLSVLSLYLPEVYFIRTTREVFPRVARGKMGSSQNTLVRLLEPLSLYFFQHML